MQLKISDTWSGFKAMLSLGFHDCRHFSPDPWKCLWPCGWCKNSVLWDNIASLQGCGNYAFIPYIGISPMILQSRYLTAREHCQHYSWLSGTPVFQESTSSLGGYQLCLPIHTQFFRNLATTHRALKKGSRRFSMSPKAKTALQTIKEALSKVSVLAHANADGKFALTLWSDAPTVTIVAGLQQTVRGATKSLLFFLQHFWEWSAGNIPCNKALSEHFKGPELQHLHRS